VRLIGEALNVGKDEARDTNDQAVITSQVKTILVVRPK
jgi:hypothetical protein